MASHLRLDAPIDRWDEALPLGNGLLGALLWGQGNHLKLSLDRGDLWDLRAPELFSRPDWTWQRLRELVAQGNQKEILASFLTPTKSLPYPTKIPAGRIELTLEATAKVISFTLDLHRAVACAELADGRFEVFCSAAMPIGMAHLSHGDLDLRLVPPSYAGEKSGPQEQYKRRLADLEYPPMQMGTRGEIQWFAQQTTEPFAYAVAVGTRRAESGTTLAFAVTTTQDAPDPVAAACARVEAALGHGFDALCAPHSAWWRDFWAVSQVTLPDAAVQQQYELANYFCGAASRRGAPPMPLQGVWTADEGGIPPWHGDYHNNLNTQLTYWPYLPANHLEEGLCYLDFLWERLPQYRDYAQRFFKVPGAVVPGVTDLAGKRMGGWVQYTHTPVNGVWVAQHFHLHWRYTMDPGFLADRAYPFCREIGVALEAITEIDPHTGRRIVPLSTSPELHSDQFAAWVKPNSNHDLALLRWLYGALAEMAAALGETEDATRWRVVLGQFGDFAIAETVDGLPTAGPGPLLIAPGEPLRESHRHHSHLLAIHPLGLLHIEGSDADRQVIRESLRQIARLGTGYWIGFSFTWMACIAARCGNAAMAEHMLGLFVKAFVARNGFHLNGDYKQLGISWFQYRPFTLEGNFAAAQAVHEMLLQGWGDVLRIFPAVPAAWDDVSFCALRAEGAWLVSATRATGRTTHVQITALRDGMLTLRDPFGGTNVTWNRPVEQRGTNLQCALRRGDRLEAWR